MRRNSLPRLSLHRTILLYAAVYFLVTLGIHLAFFPIGDIGVESDFFGDLVVAAEKLVQHDFSVANYPYKGPFYSFALVLIHLVCRYLTPQLFAEQFAESSESQEALLMTGAVSG